MLGNTWHVPSFRLLFQALAYACNIEGADDLLQEYEPLQHVKSGNWLPPAQALFGKRGRDFVEGYLELQPEPLRTLSLPFVEYFDAPDSGLNPLFLFTRIQVSRWWFTNTNFQRTRAKR